MARQNGETQALLTLLTIDDEVDISRYKQTTATEPNYEQYLDHPFEDGKRRRFGKENQIFRRQVLPKLNSSKEELKQILRRLESDEVSRKSENCQDRALQPLKSYQNEPSGKGTGMKSFRPQANDSQTKDLFLSKYTKRMRGNQPRSQLSFNDGRAQEIQFLIRKNNYSANALNLKTLNILHEINTKNSRCTSSLKKRPKCKIPECIRPNKKNMVAFLRKVA